MKDDYVLIHGELYNVDELYHYGVKGMKWGHRKAQKFDNKAKIARESAKEWDEIGAHKAGKALAKGKTAKAEKIKMKYKLRADQDRADAAAYERKAEVKRNQAAFQKKQAEAGASRSRGAKLATNVLGGPFANRTYNSVIAAGGTRNQARAATAVTTILGAGTFGLGHVAAAAIINRTYGSKDKRDR